WRHEDDWHLLVDQRDGTMLHLGRRVTLGVDVADLLEFERTLEGDREVVPATKVQEVRRVLESLGDLFDFGGAVEDRLNLLWKRHHRFSELAALHHRHVAKPRQLEREQRKRDYLARECLGRRDADFRTSVQIDPAVVLASDRRTNDVHQTERLCAT